MIGLARPASEPLISGLARDVFFGRAPWGQVVALKLKMYADESFGQRIFALSGYIASVETWTDFERAWMSVLEECEHTGNDGRIVPFHMSEFESRFGIYTDTEKWDDKRRVKLISSLIDVINVTAATSGKGFAITFPDTIIPPSTHDRKRRLGNYLAAFLQLFREVFSVLLHPDSDVEIVLIMDRQDEADGGAHLVVETVLKQIPELSDRVSLYFCSNAKAIPLQSADLLAYEAMKERHRELHDSARKPRKSWKRLDRANTVIHNYDRDSFHSRFLSLMDRLPEG
jgi:hypothetical protein